MSISEESLEQVRKCLRSKKSDEKCARKLNLSIEEYKRLKRIVIVRYQLERGKELGFLKPKVTEYKEFIDKGTAEYKAFSTTEPKTAEEIEDLLKLDTTKWRLSSYWNKQQSDGWIVSAQVTQIKKSIKEQTKSILDSIKLEYTSVETPVSQTFINTIHEANTCAVLSLQDIHVGKENLDGSGPEDIVQSVKNCVTSLIMRSYYSNKLEKIIFVLGGDLLNMDTYLGTTTSGTPVENSTDAYTAYKIAFDLMYWTVNYLKQYCETLEVVYIPGNHSRLTEAHIAYALSQSMKDPNIVWNVDYAERKVLVYGDNMICLEHGDFNVNRSFHVFATEFAKEWGNTTTRTLYLGHTHKEKKTEYLTSEETNGFTMKVLPSLCKTDRYHHQNKWTQNKRAGMIDIYSPHKGIIGTYVYKE